MPADPGAQPLRNRAEYKSAERPAAQCTLTPEEKKKFAALLRSLVTWRTLSFLNGCVNCGLCTDSCHYVTSTNDPRLIPANKMKHLSSVLKKGRVLLPGLSSRQISHHEIDALYCTVFEDCTLCGRCGMACPMGINAGPLFLAVRKVFSQLGKAPHGLDEPVKTAVEMGNYVALSNDDLVENIEWIAEELGDELEIENFSIPLDEKDQNFIYVPHPLELRDNPFLVSAAVTILHAAKERYTFSSKHFDVANYAYYAGNVDAMLHMVNQLMEARDDLNAGEVLLTPCGHGYRVLRWEAERVLGKHLPFRVYTFSEMIHRYILEGRLTIKQDVIKGPVTYHDPCNLARYGGVIEQPRAILRKVTSNFVEMEPHGEWNYCCGGGGGLSATGDYGRIRLEIGKTKADQIKATGAKVVVTNCYNCRTQISELNRKYKLGVDVKSIVEVVAASLAEA